MSKRLKRTGLLFNRTTLFAMVLSTEWSQVEVIDLINDGNGLGFTLVGGKSTGVVIKALIPGKCFTLSTNLQHTNITYKS